MHFIDTHTHLFAEEFNTDIDTVVQSAVEQDITKFYLPNINAASIEPMLQLTKRFPDKCCYDGFAPQRC